MTNVAYDSALQVPHGTIQGQTVFYDNKQSIAAKVWFKILQNKEVIYIWNKISN